MADVVALTGARIFDSQEWHDGSALLVRAGLIMGIVREHQIPADATRATLEDGELVPGFVDLQVNGGGGELFNNNPSVGTIRTICEAHARFGTTALLPTLITDAVEVIEAAIAAGISAAETAVPGFLGLHLEGPHLSVARKGTHEGSYIRPMNAEDLGRLILARRSLPNLMVTVAAETVGPHLISRLVSSGIVVSIGHSDADFPTTCAAFEAGASQATHLFNAMSQLQNREPGIVGAVLDTPDVFAGLIADGIHVHPAAIRIAIRAKRGPGQLFLVTDAMSQTGSDLTSFSLNGRTVYRANGALRLADGTLAGADLDMIDAVHFMHGKVGLSWEECLRMASLYPAQALGVAHMLGRLAEGTAASFVHLNGDRRVAGTWIEGRRVYRRA